MLICCDRTSMARVISKFYMLTEKWGGIKGRKEFYNSKTLWSRVFVEKLTVPQQVKKLSTCVGNRRYYRILKCTQPLCILRQISLVYSFSSYLMKINLNIILPAKPRYSK